MMNLAYKSFFKKSKNTGTNVVVQLVKPPLATLVSCMSASLSPGPSISSITPYFKKAEGKNHCPCGEPRRSSKFFVSAQPFPSHVTSGRVKCMEDSLSNLSLSFLKILYYDYYYYLKGKVIQRKGETQRDPPISQFTLQMAMMARVEMV